MIAEAGPGWGRRAAMPRRSGSRARTSLSW